MNNKKLAVALIAVFGIAIIGICLLFFSHPKSKSVTLDKEFTLEVDQSAVIKGKNNFKVKLTKIENSLCDDGNCEGGTLVYSFLINNVVQEMDNETNKTLDLDNYTVTLDKGDEKEVTLTVTETGDSSVDDMDSMFN